VVPAGKKFTLLDKSGVAYRTVDTQPAGLPLMRLTKPAPGDLDTRSGLSVLGSLSDELRQQLVAVSVLAPAQIKLELSKDRTVVWGDDSQNATKSEVATALLKRADHQIDVSAPNVVTIR
jgi:cell division protein FtsQ